MNLDCREVMNRRLAGRPAGPLDVRSKLRHFALINYALPKSRLEPYIPADRFEIPEFPIGGRRLAMMSAVPFLDADFHFPRIVPFLKFGFGQTNYRVYVIDRRSGEHGVWFFGTTLGSAVVHLARVAWKIPWHPAGYEIDCEYDRIRNRYSSYRYAVDSAWGPARIDVEDTGEPVTTVEGFDSLEEAMLILTHPVDGFFRRLDGRLGGYSVGHEPIPITDGRARHLSFGLYRALGLLTDEEMERPHSVFLCPETEFRVFLPPRLIAD